jgi:hypothetical protein
MKDYYKVLGVSPGAPAEAIKAAYRALMKKNHPDVGGDTQRAMEIEEAYRHLSGALQPAIPRTVSRPQPRTTPAVRRQSLVRQVLGRGKYIEVELLEMQPNQVLACPRECSFHSRNCRYKQQLSVESKDLFAFRATTVLVRVRNPATFAQQVDFRSGKAAIIDQLGDFYHCQTVCNWQHPPKYKEATVEMFPGTQATLMLWFPQLPAGRYVTRFVYKHKILVRDERGDWQDEELLELTLA